ncbi:LADA_0H07734g1_1 [Lachancea dasiensis]|uniref:LADA_0H07734g1_1 n=1 Tax=Lachancea dasiensis TaxID=1072105 RepID=A0A1G4K2F3_9SACH|nr:LADA_0H07734g1_1 [Lachancea dasiensis]
MDATWAWLESFGLVEHYNLVKSELESAIQTAQQSEMSKIYTATALGALVLWLVLRPSTRAKGRKEKRGKGKNKKKSGAAERKPLTLEEQLELVQQRYVSEFKSDLDHLIENFDADSEKQQYQRNYFNEMLLKLVIELDGVDLVDVEGERKKALKIKRKQIIKEIQFDLKRLDSLKRITS